jgi:hypothetical protein
VRSQQFRARAVWRPGLRILSVKIGTIRGATCTTLMVNEREGKLATAENVSLLFIPPSSDLGCKREFTVRRFKKKKKKSCAYDNKIRVCKFVW